jgi:hypothetical protein
LRIDFRSNRRILDAFNNGTIPPRNAKPDFELPPWIVRNDRSFEKLYPVVPMADNAFETIG